MAATEKQKQIIHDLQSYALKHGFDKVTFKNHFVRNAVGDFTIYLYDYKKNPKRYVVGFDGVWENGWMMSFDRVIEQVYEYINLYNK